MTPIVETVGVTKCYRQGRAVITALDGVSLRIEAGEFVAVMGRSGSGKTTLLDVIGMLCRPTTGQLRLGGVDASTLTDRERTRLRRRSIGFVFQEYNLLPALSALENVLLPVRYERSLDLAGSIQRARQLLDLVGLAERAGHRPRELSGGERQRVAIARALVLKPALVLADEPPAAVDSDTGSHLLDLLCRLQRREGVTFVLVTHDPEVAAAADRVIRLRDGRIEARAGGEWQGVVRLHPPQLRTPSRALS